MLGAGFSNKSFLLSVRARVGVGVRAVRFLLRW